jgi:TPR repeat protein
MYEAGHNVSLDIGKAMDLYRRAAELGDAPAQFRVASQMLGSSESAVIEEAARLLACAAGQGYSSAHRSLGYLYMNGAPGITADRDRARSHFDAAEKLENP